MIASKRSEVSTPSACEISLETGYKHLSAASFAGKKGFHCAVSCQEGVSLESSGFSLVKLIEYCNAYLAFRPEVSFRVFLINEAASKVESLAEMSPVKTREARLGQIFGLETVPEHYKCASKFEAYFVRKESQKRSRRPVVLICVDRHPLGDRQAQLY